MGTLEKQYKKPGNLGARGSLHKRFSTNPQGWYRWYFEQINLPSDAVILELGCGPGGLWKANIEEIPAGWKFTLSDFSEGMIETSQQGLEDDRFSFEVFNAGDIPYGDNQFDAVFANHMLYHVADLDKTLADIRRILKPTGILYAGTNGVENMKEYWDIVATVSPSYQKGDAEFTLENGSQYIGKHFSSVELLRYEDSLIVPEVEPLIRYGESTLALVDATASDFAKLAELFEKKISKDGPIEIQKDAGVFIAKGAKENA